MSGDLCRSYPRHEPTAKSHAARDEKVHQAYCEWSDKWYHENPDGNQYNDYFEALFAENYKKYSDFQREGGDWLNWNIPGTDHTIPMFQSGFGDGCYPVYWGIDKDGNVCELLVQFIDIALAYGQSAD